VLMPPLSISPDEIRLMCAGVASAIDDFLNNKDPVRLNSL